MSEELSPACDSGAEHRRSAELVRSQDGCGEDRGTAGSRPLRYCRVRLGVDEHRRDSGDQGGEVRHLRLFNDLFGDVQATEEEFIYFLKKYLRPGYDTHPILYLGFHGRQAEDGADAFVEIGDRTRVTLERLEEWIAGRCRSRLVHFGACGVMASHGNRLNRFVKSTAAVGVCGYREDVDWLESAAFETLAVGRLQGAAFTKSSIQKFDRHLKQIAPGLYERLGFRLVAKT